MNQLDSRQPGPPVRPAALRILLLNPGAAEESWVPDHTGHVDPGLGDAGRAQAACLAREVASASADQIAALYCSPLRVAVETAAILAEILRLAGVIQDANWVTVAGETLSPGAEGLAAHAAIQDRAWASVESIREGHKPPAVVAVVSHRLPLQATICRALSMPLEGCASFRLDEASLSAIEFRGERTLLTALNQACEP